MGNKDQRFRYHDDPEVLTYDQLLEKLQQVFEKTDFAYGIEALSIDPDWCISELEQSRNVELVDEEDDESSAVAAEDRHKTPGGRVLTVCRPRPITC